MQVNRPGAVYCGVHAELLMRHVGDQSEVVLPQMGWRTWTSQGWMLVQISWISCKLMVCVTQHCCVRCHIWSSQHDVYLSVQGMNDL